MDIKTVKYYNNKGELHCEFQPAIIISEDDTVKEIHYYLDGVEYSDYNKWLDELINRDLYYTNEINIVYYKKVNINENEYFYWKIEHPDIWKKNISMHKTSNRWK